MWFDEDQRTNIIDTYSWKWLENAFKFDELNTERNWENLCIPWRNQQTYTSDDHYLHQGRPNFQSGFCSWFTQDMLMQHKFEDVILISRRWRTRKTNRITPACLKPPNLGTAISFSWWRSSKQQDKGACLFIKKERKNHIKTKLSWLFWENLKTLFASVSIKHHGQNDRKYFLIV